VNWGKVQAWLHVGASVVIITTGVSAVVTALVGWLLRAVPLPWLALLLVGTFLMVFGASISVWRQLVPKTQPTPEDNVTIGMVSHQPLGIAFSGELAIAAEHEAKLEHQLNKMKVQLQALETEVQGFGLNSAARKYLKRTLDELPPLTVGFAKDFAGLLHAAHKDPFTAHPIELKDEGPTGTVVVPDINRSMTFPIETAKNVHRHMEEMIRDARNDRTREAGLAPSETSR
jgi:hypothetical protein